jgi:hypothetical protein
MRAKGGGATIEWAVHAARMRYQLENSLARRRLEAHLEVRVPGHQVVRLLIRTLHEDVDDALERSQRRMSVATWSLRERPVCSLPPSGPISSLSRRSFAV